MWSGDETIVSVHAHASNIKAYWSYSAILQISLPTMLIHVLISLPILKPHSGIDHPIRLLYYTVFTSAKV